MKSKKIFKGFLELWKNLDKSKKERQLEKSLIRPILEMLDFVYVEDSDKGPCYEIVPTLTTHTGDKREPDYALFSSRDDFEQARAHKDYFFEFTIGVGDAKRWDVNLDKKPTSRGRSPSLQIIEYLIESKKRYGFLTNGKKWRIYRTASAEALLRPDIFLEMDLESIALATETKLRAWHISRRAENKFDINNERIFWLAHFILLFGPSAFTGDGTTGYVGTQLLEKLYIQSMNQRVEMQEDLKHRVFYALEIVCNAFYKCPHWKGKTPPSTDELQELFSTGLIFLYRILFILNAESRQLLDSAQYRSMSFSRLAERIRQEKRYITKLVEDLEYTYWRNIKKIFQVLSEKEAARRIGITHYDGGLFDNQARFQKNLNLWKVDDESLFFLIGRLLYANIMLGKVEQERQIDYGALEVRHLGSIYEGLLEYRLSHNSDDNTLFLYIDSSVRKKTGTYYTPDYIVDYIVDQTLRPLVEDCNNWEDVLKVKVLDPAMGSGHFLIAAIDYLAGAIHARPDEIIPPQFETDDETDELIIWKRIVAESCIYGVDVNPLAVELAKLSVWLTTVNKGKALSFLNHHLRCGNSLLGTHLNELESEPLKIRNNQGVRTGAQDQTTLTNFIERKIGKIAKSAQEIAEASPVLAEGIALLKKRYEQEVTNPMSSLRTLADIWMNQWFCEGGKTSKTRKLIARDYQSFVKKATKNNLQSTILKEKPRRYFHWEIEFPEVFAAKNEKGFDAIIGNPPYGVLSRRQIEQDIENDLWFLRECGFYEMVMKGSLNLFPLFIVRCLHLLKQNGQFSMIVPTALLGSGQSYGLRNWFLESKSSEHRVPIQDAQLIGIDVFPQKDNRELRVFKDAKQATCIFHVIGAHSPSHQIQIRTHPGRDFAKNGAVYEITPSQILSLDPDSAVIPYGIDRVGRGLALRLPKVKKFVELGTVARVFHGEFHLTDAKRRGLISETPIGEAPLLIRGAHVGRYYLQKAKQGTELYVNLDVLDKTIKKSRKRTKLSDPEKSRIIFQQSAPADNYRRIIATCVEPPTYCGNTINYVTDNKGQDIYAILAVLNSTISEWRFRLTSGTNHVNAYEIERTLIPSYKIDWDLRDGNEIEDRTEYIDSFLTSLENGKSQELHLKLKTSISRNRNNEYWPNMIHDGFASLGRWLNKLGQERQNKIKYFVDWLDDYFLTSTDEWKGKSKFRIFHNLDFKDFYSMCQRNSKSIGRKDFDSVEIHGQLKKEFGKTLREVKSLLKKSSTAEDIINDLLFDMMQLTKPERKTVKTGSGTRIPTA